MTLDNPVYHALSVHLCQEKSITSLPEFSDSTLQDRLKEASVPKRSRWHRVARVENKKKLNSHCNVRDQLVIRKGRSQSEWCRNHERAWAELQVRWLVIGRRR